MSKKKFNQTKVGKFLSKTAPGILDLAGDFLLSGFRVLGSVTCVQGGHNLSYLFLKKIFNDTSNFTKFEVDEAISTKSIFKTPVNKLAVNA